MTKNTIYIIILLVIASCNVETENDSLKRNSEWIWITDLEGNNAKWVKNGGNDTSYFPLKYKVFYDNGVINEKGTLIKNGVHTDTTYYYDKSGKLIRIRVYNGKFADDFYFKEGKINIYYNTGELQFTGFVKNGTLVGNWKCFLLNGILEKEGNRSSYKSTGWVQTYFKNGERKDSAYRLNGELHGIGKSWYENGQIESFIEYSYGKLNGVFKRWYQNGNLEEVVYYKNDTLDGDFTLFYKNSNVYEKKYFNNGFNEGEYLAFYPNGKLVISGNYKKNVMDGKWNYYTINGDIYKTEILLNGNILSSKNVKKITKEEENYIIEFCNYSKNN